MKKILSSIIGRPVEDILKFGYQSENYGLTIEQEHDYDQSYPVLRGDIYEPSYIVEYIDSYDNKKTIYVSLSELFEEVSKLIPE